MTLKHFKTDLQAVKYMITQSGESSWSLEKSTGISRQTIDRWIKADYLKIRRATLSDFASKLNYQIQYSKNGIAVSPHTKKQESGDLNMEQQQMLIELQAEKIKRLEQQLAPNKFQMINVDINYQFIIYAKYELQGIGMPKIAYQSNTYDKDYPCMQNYKFLSKKFGYTEEEIINAWSLDNFYKYDDHPIHMLRSKKHKIGVIKQAVSMLTTMLSNKNTLEFMTIKLPIIYQAKDGSPLHCMNKYEVDTVNKIVLCALHFMNGTD